MLPPSRSTSAPAARQSLRPPAPCPGWGLGGLSPATLPSAHRALTLISQSSCLCARRGSLQHQAAQTPGVGHGGGRCWAGTSMRGSQLGPGWRCHRTEQSRVTRPSLQHAVSSGLAAAHTHSTVNSTQLPSRNWKCPREGSLSTPSKPRALGLL